ncbi:MAG: extracellular solute-binding protein [Zoogloeaceae bacterium]|jgi:sn-glycerol 3-phosphate transport system substrate-binding protein|nr:extracellular solute-binding protein [Zoogloeaceae bacterium]
MKRACLVLLCAAFCLGGVTGVVAAPKKVAKPAAKKVAQPEEIVLAHQLSFDDAQRLQKLVDRFNASQKEAVIKLSSGIGKKPAPLNLATMSTVAGFAQNKGSFVSVSQIMREAKEKEPSGLSGDLPETKKPFALPVAFSTPVLFYNKRVFRDKGLDPNKPPKTWHEMQDMAGVLMDRGMTCPYTSSRPVWVHIDNANAISGVPAASKAGKLQFNGIEQIRHLAMLATWHKAKYFQTFGRGNEADWHFYNGQCAMITTDASAQTLFAQADNMDLGVAPMPRYEDAPGGPAMADGASLWVGKGYSKATYRQVARFLQFVLSPQTTIEIARVGGYLPLTPAARAAVRSAALAPESEALEVASQELQGADKTGARLRVAAIDPVRIIVDEEMEAVWKGKPAKTALDDAVRRGNAVLASKPALKKLAVY